MSANFTPRQGQYLAFIHLYMKLNRRAPAEADIQAHFRVSAPSVHQMIVSLENRGLIQRTPGQARSIRLLVSPESLPDIDGNPVSTIPGQSFVDLYPTLAKWITKQGWIELGY